CAAVGARVNHDFTQHRTQDPFLRLGRRRRMVPHRRQVVAQDQQPFPFLGTDRGGTGRGCRPPLLQLPPPGQGRLPTLLHGPRPPAVPPARRRPPAAVPAPPRTAPPPAPGPTPRAVDAAHHAVAPPRPAPPAPLPAEGRSAPVPPPPDPRATPPATGTTPSHVG